MSPPERRAATEAREGALPPPSTPLFWALAGVACVGAVALALGAVAARRATSRELVELLVLTAGFAVLSLRPLRLPSGAILHPGVVLSTASVFLLSPLLAALVPVPGLVVLTLRSRRPAWAVLFTVGHGALSLWSAAVVYRAIAPEGPPSLPGMLPGALPAIVVHEVAQWLVSAVMVAHRQGRTLREQVHLIVHKDINWGTLGLNLLGITAALSYHEQGVWGLGLQVALLLSLFQSITYYTRLEVWQQAAHTDGLTGVGNRAAWEAFGRSLRAGTAKLRGTLFVLDLNDLKLLNDRHGHAVGDDALRELARILKGTLRRSDQLFRYGGDEFVAFLPHGPGAEEAVRARVEAAVERFAEGWAVRGIPATVSLGAATAPAESEALDDLFGLADARMYARKEAYRRSAARVPLLQAERTGA